VTTGEVHLSSFPAGRELQGIIIPPVALG